MSELTENIRQELKDKETRFIYDDDLLNTYIATQIRTLREKKGWTQQKLAEEAGMKQERISVLEDVNYSSWTAKVLRRLARAFDLRLTIKFEEFNTFFKDFEGVKPELLQKRSFEDDPAFKDDSTPKDVVDSDQVSIPALMEIYEKPMRFQIIRANNATVYQPSLFPVEPQLTLVGNTNAQNEAIKPRRKARRSGRSAIKPSDIGSDTWRKLPGPVIHPQDFNQYLNERTA